MCFRRVVGLVPLTLLVGVALAGNPWAAFAAPPKPAAAAPALKTFKVRQAVFEADLAGAAQVTIENKFGHVHVRAGGPRVKVEETAYAHGRSQADATARAKGFHVTTKKDAKEGLKITVEGDAKNVDVGFNLVVSMPPTTKVKVRVSDGDVRVDDFTADVTVDGSSGAVSIGKVKGKVGASTAGGSISIAGALGGAEAQTSSGSINLVGANGKVTTRTMSGAIKAQVGKSDKIIASTMSGAIDVTVSSPFSGQLQASSSSGDIRLAIPSNSDCKVTTATGSGATKVTLPLKDVKRNGPNYDAGHLGSGKGAVRVTNDSGAITIVPTK